MKFSILILVILISMGVRGQKELQLNIDDIILRYEKYIATKDLWYLVESKLNQKIDLKIYSDSYFISAVDSSYLKSLKYKDRILKYSIEQIKNKKKHINVFINFYCLKNETIELDVQFKILCKQRVKNNEIKIKKIIGAVALGHVSGG